MSLIEKNPSCQDSKARSPIPKGINNKSGSYRFCKILVILFLVSIQSVFAEEKGDETTYKVETIEIVGEKNKFYSYETGDVLIDEISGFSKVITRDRFEGKTTDLASVIQKEAGIHIRKSGGLGSFSTVSIRGSTNEQVLIFIDGVLLNGASGGGVNLGNISLSDVESIEIFRGNTPIQFGTASIGGVVNIRTRRTVTSDKESTLTVTSSLGSFDTKQGSFFFNHRPGKFDYLISGEFISSAGDFPYKNTKNVMDSSENSPWERRENNQLKQYNLLLKGGYTFTSDKRLYFSNEYFKKKQGLPYWNNAPNVNTGLTTTRNVFIGKYIENHIGTLDFNSASRFQYSWKSELYDDRDDNMGLGAQLNEYNMENYGLNQLFELSLEHNLIITVIDIKHETFEAVDKLNDKTYRPSWRKTISGAIEDNIRLFDKSLSLIPCARYYHIVDKLQNNDYSEGSKEEKSYFTPKFGLLWKISDWLRLKGNIGKYVREPSFMELFGDRGFYYGNADLVAEKGINRDIGLEAKFFPKSNFAVQSIKTGLVFFSSDIENLITFVYDARGIGKALNLSDAEITGIEYDFSIDFLEYLSFSFNYTQQEAVGHSVIGYANKKRLPGRYANSYTGRLEANAFSGKLYYEILVEDGMYYDEAELLKAPKKNIHNAGLSYSVGSFTALLEVQNLTNDEHEDFHGYPQPGISYFANIKYQY